MSEIALHLDEVRARLARAVQDSNRVPQSVTLLAVSKRQPAQAIRDAYDAGQRDFGENYAQELSEKAAELADLSELRWHMIGHLQRNKVKLIATSACSVHSVHSLELVREHDKRRAGMATALDVLVEVNVGGEAQKSGCAPEAVSEILSAVEGAAGLRLVGLMCVPPHTPDPAGARPFFDALREVREIHGGVARLPALSMGMTADLEVAVAAGATIVRVGTAIFGERPRVGA